MAWKRTPHTRGADTTRQNSPDAADGAVGIDPKRWPALLVCLVGLFIVFLDVSIVNVALPMISAHLHASGSGLQWVVSGYALAFGLFLVPSGRLGDIYGHRVLFVAGLALFVTASAACGAAPTMVVLVIGRIVQGAAGGVLTPRSAPPSRKCSAALSARGRSATSAP